MVRKTNLFVAGIIAVIISIPASAELFNNSACIFPFKAHGISMQLSASLTGTFSQMLVNHAVFRIIPPEGARNATTRIRDNYALCADTECAAKIGYLMGASVSFIGGITEQGGTYFIDVYMVDSQEGTVIATRKTSGRDIATLERGLDIIAQQFSLLFSEELQVDRELKKDLPLLMDPESDPWLAGTLMYQKRYEDKFLLSMAGASTAVLCTTGSILRMQRIQAVTGAGGLAVLGRDPYFYIAGASAAVFAVFGPWAFSDYLKFKITRERLAGGYPYSAQAVITADNAGLAVTFKF